MLFSVRRDDGTSIRRQLRDQIRHLVRHGTLPLGTRLPSSRDLARSLGVSRNTVVEVYEALAADGIVQPSSTAGTFVTWRQEKRLAARAGASSPWRATGSPVAWERLIPEGTRRWSERPDARRPSRSRIGAWWDEASAERFRTCLNRALRQKGPTIFGSGEPEGYRPLREWLAAHMAERGVRTDADGVLVVDGFRQALDLVTRVLVNLDDPVLVQEPVRPGVISTLREAGARVKGVPVAPGGLDLAALESITGSETPRLMYVMPTAHDPTGVTMDLPTRGRLLECARRRGFLLLEDAVNDELHYMGHLVPPLKAQDELGWVIYVGSMSKALFPAVGVGWIIAEPPALAALSAAKGAGDFGSSQLLQAALSEFCRLGHFRRHLTRARRACRVSLQALEQALALHLPPGATWESNDSPPAMWVTLPEGVDSRRLQVEAAARGVQVEPGDLFYVNAGGRSHLRAAWPEANPLQIERDVAVIGKLIRAALTARKSQEVRDGGAVLRAP